MTKQKILVPSEKSKFSQIILDTAPEAPEGYEIYYLNDVQWTLMDSMGRLNISWIYTWASTMNPDIANRRPAKWLENKLTKQLRANYKNILGFDPVNVVNGGYRGKKSQSPNSDSDGSQAQQGIHQVPYMEPDENQVQQGIHQGPNSDSGGSQAQQGFQGIHQVSGKGAVQVYGTYMSDRMVVSYGSWVSFEFHQYVMDIFIRHANNPLSPSGLILPKDELHAENDAINSRHSKLLLNAENVKDRFKSPDGNSFDIETYVQWLRDDFNIDITVPDFLKWLCHVGLFYKDALRNAVEGIDLYQPKSEYVVGIAPMFTINNHMVEGKVIVSVSITQHTHSCLIDSIMKDFDMIVEE